MFKQQAITKSSNLILHKDIDEDNVTPEYEYDEKNDDVSEDKDKDKEEYDNDVMEETVIEREEGPDLR